MFLLSPRFFALPLIAVVVILSLPRGPQTQAVTANLDMRVPQAQLIADCGAQAQGATCAYSVADSATTTLR